VSRGRGGRGRGVGRGVAGSRRGGAWVAASGGHGVGPVPRGSLEPRASASPPGPACGGPCRPGLTSRPGHARGDLLRAQTARPARIPGKLHVWRLSREPMGRLGGYPQVATVCGRFITRLRRERQLDVQNWHLPEAGCQTSRCGTFHVQLQRRRVSFPPNEPYRPLSQGRSFARQPHGMQVPHKERVRVVIWAKCMRSGVSTFRRQGRPGARAGRPGA
jgi:hypothetical protein